MSTLRFDRLIGFSFDVEPGETKSQWQPAEAKKGLALFGDLRLLGFVSALELGIAQRLTLIGGDEVEHGINRAEAIRLMLIHDHGIDPGLIEARRSNPNTKGNLEIINEMVASGLRRGETFAGMSNKYHLERMHQDRNLPSELRLLPAESVWLLATDNSMERDRRRSILMERFRNGLIEREIAEMNGIADMYAGNYRPQ